MNPRTAIVTGVSGQDGSYLAELLLDQGYTVVGLGRGTAGGPRHERLLWRSCEVTDTPTLEELLREHRPAEVYNLAAMSSGAGMFDEAIRLGEVNGLAVARLLEAIRNVEPRIRLCQASSSELFGNVQTSPQSEDTPPRPRSPYGAAKLYADTMVRIYRERYGMFACSAILFNHESPRRRLEFVTRKVTHAAASIKLQLESELTLGSLEARRDWGFAGDYVRAMWLMLQHPHAQDYVVASGQTHSVRELCAIAFGHVGLDYRDFVRENGDSARAPEAVALVGDASRARCSLNWSPRVSFRQMVTDMVDSDLKTIQDRLLEKASQQ
ncbi:GDP-mannose 4,6-dehydratase [Rhizobacter sp. SG703]|uniref:GDP-mannose 4,6-dehydratase n=1 Tax=Rhizobacter sp. SG703 TaxID=2587140 RepID=UPI0014450DC0|nr:GDPmannose 4,6-dehydratase [Rhizobacter sp. SG703]